MIAELTHYIFEKIGHTWRIGGANHTPTERDVEQVLDAAAGRLYDSDADTRLETGGLIIEKRPQGQGFDVYVYVGNYK